MSKFSKQEAKRYVQTFPDTDVEDLVNFVVEDHKPHRSNLPRFKRRARFILREAKLELEGPEVQGTIEAPEEQRAWAEGHTFVFTSAQANTHLNENFWLSLMALVEDRQASLHISRFTYDKSSYGKKSVKPGSHKQEDNADIWFDSRIDPYVSDESTQITDDLVWCGELNIIPTRADPISGFESYGRGSSVIIPHVKMQMKSVPTMKHEEPLFCYSTGTITARNYIEKAAGQKASLHHVYGAILVEVDRHGNWWARQINADKDGLIYDLTDCYAPDGQIYRNIPVQAVTNGDLHGNKIDLGVAECMKSALSVLKPRHQMFHDTVDFQPRNHHNRRDAHFLHQMHCEVSDHVGTEFEYIANILRDYFVMPGCQHWIITSNHDQAVENWLRDTTAFFDPVNMQDWLEMNLYCAKMREKGKTPRPFWTWLRKYLPNGFVWQVVHEDDNLCINGIEYGMHGHNGPKGAKGTPNNLRVVGKANTMHTHSAGIKDGVYTGGVFGNLDMGYNRGPSDWSHSFIVTYQNGKRTIITIKENKAWR